MSLRRWCIFEISQLASIFFFLTNTCLTQKPWSTLLEQQAFLAISYLKDLWHFWSVTLFREHDCDWAKVLAHAVRNFGKDLGMRDKHILQMTVHNYSCLVNDSVLSSWRKAIQRPLWRETETDFEVIPVNPDRFVSKWKLCKGGIVL